MIESMSAPSPPSLAKGGDIPVFDKGWMIPTTPDELAFPSKSLLRFELAAATPLIGLQFALMASLTMVAAVFDRAFSRSLPADGAGKEQKEGHVVQPRR
jgi:hypothetical protein